MTFTEMKRRFHGQWLAIRVTRRDETGQPTAGKVIARSPSRMEVSEAAKEEKHVCLVYAGEPIPKGYGVVLHESCEMAPESSRIVKEAVS